VLVHWVRSASRNDSLSGKSNVALEELRNSVRMGGLLAQIDMYMTPLESLMSEEQSAVEALRLEFAALKRTIEDLM